MTRSAIRSAWVVGAALLAAATLAACGSSSGSSGVRCEDEQHDRSEAVVHLGRGEGRDRPARQALLRGAAAPPGTGGPHRRRLQHRTR